MLARDEFTTTTLRGLKSAILYEEVAKGKRDQGLSDAEIESVVASEVKKRSDAIKIYTDAGDATRAEKEDREQKILANYLPRQLSHEEERELVAQIISENNFTAKDFGRIIGEAKKRAGNATTGERIAVVVKELLK